MKHILIIDSICYKPYTYGTIDLAPLGGTEATAARIAHALGESSKVTFMQRHRIANSYDGDNVTYTRLSFKSDKYDAIIVIRDYLLAAELKAQYKNTPVYLWLHDLASNHDAKYGAGTQVMGIEVIVVSNFHKQNLQEKYRSMDNDRMPKVHMIYNPIDDDLDKDTTPVNKNKLVFFSSPHKGLDYTMEVFQAALNFNPDFELHISNPGYYADCFVPHNYQRVVNHGQLAHPEAIQHVREALCVFYPNHVFPETFGLVYAEANAVGTPVLTHRHGAVREVLYDNRQIIDVRDKKVLLDTLMRWYNGDRPKVFIDEKFRLNNIVQQWKDLLKI